MINFKPWVGDRYSSAPFGKRVLVLGESHYCADFFALVQGDEINLVESDKNDEINLVENDKSNNTCNVMHCKS